MVRDGVRVLVLLALSDDGVPAHDHHEAEALTALGATVTSCTPDEFPDVLAAPSDRSGGQTAAMQWPDGFRWGTGRVVDAVRGRVAGIGLAALGAIRARPAVGRRQRLRDPLRRGLRAARRARPDPPSAVARLGAASSRSRGQRDRGGRSRTTATMLAAAHDAGHRAVGVPAPLHAAAVVRRRRRLRGRRPTARARGPATSSSSPRRSATSRRVAADQRGQHLRPARVPCRDRPTGSWDAGGRGGGRGVHPPRQRGGRGTAAPDGRAGVVDLRPVADRHVGRR